MLRNDRIWLNGDQGGDGLVLTCSGKGHTHTVLQIRTRGGPPHVTLARRGQGVVPVSPIVDGGGYTLVTTVHPPSLVPTRIASLSDLPDLGDEPDNGEEQDDGDETDHPNGHGLGQVQKCLR